MVSANVFVQPDVIADDTFLFDYSLFFVDVLYNYLQSAEDIATARELWPTARRQVELALTRCDASGIVRDSDDWWVFIDWQASHVSLKRQATPGKSPGLHQKARSVRTGAPLVGRSAFLITA